MSTMPMNIAPSRRAATDRHIAGVIVLTRFLLRRDRIKLPVWVGALGLFVIYIGSALPTIAPTSADLQSMTVLFTQPVGRLFTGPAFGMDAPTYERFFAVGYSPYIMVAGALMNIMLITRHTRAEEQSGRAELLRANVTGRYTALMAALLVATITNVLAAIVVSACAIAVGFASSGSLLIGLCTGLIGIAFAGITAVTAQLSEYSRTAAGIAGAVLGVAFILRGLGDMVAIGGSALSWASPLGWTAQTAPYVYNRQAPLLLLCTLAAVTIAGAFILQARRDFGAGLFAARPGPAYAHRALGTPLGLAIWLHRGGIVGWGSAIVLLGAIEGAFTQALIDAGANLPEALSNVVGSDSGLVVGYLTFLGSFVAILIAAYTVFATQTLRNEEIQGRVGAVLATPISRITWLGSQAATIAVAAVVMAVLAGLGTGVAATIVTGDWSLIGDAIAAHIGPMAAVLLLLSIWIAFVGWAPRMVSIVGWSGVALTAIITIFGDLLNVPRWLAGLSPFTHLAQLPRESFALMPLLTQCGIALVLTAIGLTGIRTRQINVV